MVKDLARMADEFFELPDASVVESLSGLGFEGSGEELFLCVERRPPRGASDWGLLVLLDGLGFLFCSASQSARNLARRAASSSVSNGGGLLER